MNVLCYFHLARSWVFLGNEPSISGTKNFMPLLVLAPDHLMIPLLWAKRVSMMMVIVYMRFLANVITVKNTDDFGGSESTSFRMYRSRFPTLRSHW
jgi:hypothetical protein